MTHGGRKREGVAVIDVVKTVQAEPQQSDVDSPLYGVALLKVAMELKKPNPQPLEDILSAVLTRMRIDEAAFRRFLAKNGGLLRTIAERKQP